MFARSPIPRSLVPIGIDATLRGSLARRAAGRDLVIDAFRSWQCGTWVGDLTAEWRRGRPGDDYAELEPIEGVRVHVRRRLLGLLHAAGPTIVASRIPLLGGLAVSLERPELWIDYLDRPSAFEEATIAEPVTAEDDRAAAAGG